jgi:GntR family transcriptional regulator, carbon starvation induced regulator
MQSRTSQAMDGLDNVLDLASRLQMDAQPAAPTRATAIYAVLRREIIRGELLPGEKLRVEALAERCKVGATPVREALNRLSMEGLVSQQDQRGFRVTPVSTQHLVELTRTRIWVTEIALRESIDAGDAAWEDRIVVAYRRLARTPNRLAERPHELNPEWENLHRSFHSALVAACPSRMLLEFSERLFEEGERYRHLSVRGSSSGARDVREEHRQLLEATLARDTGEAVRLMNQHTLLTTRTLLDFLSQQEAAGAA